MEKDTLGKEAHGEFESECQGVLRSAGYVLSRHAEGVGRIPADFIDTYSKVAFAKLYDRKTPITAADLLNDRVVPFFDEHEIPLSRVLTDRGTEYCGTPEHHEYEVYLAAEDIDPTRTKVKSAADQRDLRALRQDRAERVYRVAFRKKLYLSLEELQKDLDSWLEEYSERWSHQADGATVKPRHRRSIRYRLRRSKSWRRVDHAHWPIN